MRSVIRRNSYVEFPPRCYSVLCMVLSIAVASCFIFGTARATLGIVAMIILVVHLDLVKRMALQYDALTNLAGGS